MGRDITIRGLVAVCAAAHLTLIGCVTSSLRPAEVSQTRETLVAAPSSALADPPTSRPTEPPSPVAAPEVTVGAGSPAPASTQPAIRLSPLDNFHAIASGRAYRSGQLSVEKLRMVCEEHKIQTVINLRGPNPQHEWYRDEKAACDAMGVKLIDIAWSAKNLPEREKLLAYFDAIRESDATVLIHCSAGADRTGAAAAIWRMVVAGEEKSAASRELSLRFGHFRAATPKMDELVEVFQTSREWIEREYLAGE